MQIDFHVHCFPDELAKKAVSQLAAAADTEAFLDGTIADLRRSMQEAGITHSVVQPVATRPQQVRKINTWAAANQSADLIFFASFHPELGNWKEEVKFIKEAGLPGVKFHPDYQQFFVDEPRLFSIYEALFNEDLIILFHAGVDIGLPPPVHCTPERLAKLVHLFPGGKIVAAHMGGYLCWGGVEEHLAGKEIYFDTSYSIADLGKEAMTRLILAHGPEKILFATDSPWTPQREELAKIRELSLPPSVLEKILGLNAASLLGLPAGAISAGQAGAEKGDTERALRMCRIHA
ncbi:MAG: amidohydrolase family protein [Bacillota bacterium]|nr:amidohydrolase family protein [Bacillota bacterium]